MEAVSWVSRYACDPFLTFTSVLNVTLLCVCNRTESGQPICGNGLVEPGEECDCGYSDQCKDDCCYDANQPDNKKCKLKPNRVCR